MAMNITTLGKALHSIWNKYKTSSTKTFREDETITKIVPKYDEQSSYKNLGNRMYDEMMKIQITQGSSSSEDLGRLRMQAIAKVLIDDFMSVNNPVMVDRFNGIASELLKHIWNEAEINPIDTTLVAPSNPHQHQTMKKKGAIR